MKLTLWGDAAAVKLTLWGDAVREAVRDHPTLLYRQRSRSASAHRAPAVPSCWGGALDKASHCGGLCWGL